MKTPAIGDLRWTVQIVRRTSLAPAPLSAEVTHTYTVVATTRAKAETKGTSEFNRVVIADQEVSHVFWIRFTSIPFDTRDRLRDALGNLYSIAKVDVVEERRRWMRIFAVKLGSETRPVVS